MIPTREDIAQYLYGAYLIARLDRSGLGLFDVSFRGFWTSFIAALIVLPGYAAMVFMQAEAGAPTNEEGRSFWADGTAYVLNWTLFPIVAAILAVLMDLKQNYVPYVIVANWASVIQIALMVTSLTIARYLPEELANLIVLAVTLFLLFYDWFVARVAFQATASGAIGVVVINLMVGSVIRLAIARFG